MDELPIISNYHHKNPSSYAQEFLYKVLSIVESPTWERIKIPKGKVYDHSPFSTTDGGPIAPLVTAPMNPKAPFKQPPLNQLSFLPEYMQEDVIGLYGNPNSADYYDYQDDNSIYYLIMCFSPDGAVCAECCSYVLESDYYANLYIYDLAE